MKEYLKSRPILDSLKNSATIAALIFVSTSAIQAGTIENIYNFGKDIANGNTRGVIRHTDRTINKGIRIYEGQQKQQERQARQEQKEQEQKEYEKIRKISQGKRDRISNANNHARDINATTNAFENISNAEERQLEYLIKKLDIPLMSTDKTNYNRDSRNIQNLENIGNIIQTQNKSEAEKYTNIFQIKEGKVSIKDDLKREIGKKIKEIELEIYRANVTPSSAVIDELDKLVENINSEPSKTSYIYTSKTPEVSSKTSEVSSKNNENKLTSTNEVFTDIVNKELKNLKSNFNITNLEEIKNTIINQDLETAKNNTDIYNIKNGKISVSPKMEEALLNAQYEIRNNKSFSGILQEYNTEMNSIMFPEYVKAEKAENLGKAIKGLTPEIQIT